MANIIEVSNVSKRYSIGKRASYGSLREEIMQSVLSPFRRVFSPADGLDDENSVWALKDISFAVQEGEVLGVVGRNGAGKSTLLKILSRITGPTEGAIVMRGRVASLLEVGTGFHPELTGRENIFLNGALLGMRSAEIKAKFDEIVAFSEIERFLDTPVKRYSSGMYVRLAFAVAAHLEPEILIIDEVLAVGDASFQKKCLGKMGDVAKGGRTVLFVSHNMPAVQKLCTRAILLEGGRLSAAGETEDMVNRYLAGTRTGAIDKDLSVIPRHGEFGRKVRITACRVLGSNGAETDTLKFGEPFSVEVECAGMEPMSGLQFAVGINSALDQRISTILSHGEERAFTLKQGEKKTGALKVDGLILTPGSYSLTLGIRDGITGYDHLQNVFYFSVVSARYEDVNKSDEIINYGLVHLSNPYWKII